MNILDEKHLIVLNTIVEEKNIHIREIARKSGLSASYVCKAVKDLEKYGLIEKRSNGRNVTYTPNEDSFLLAEIKKLLVLINLYPLVERIRDKCYRIILFGSAARGEYEKHSDIDLLIVSENAMEVKKYLSENVMGKKLSVIILRKREYLSLRKRDPVFWKEVNRGIVLK